MNFEAEIIKDISYDPYYKIRFSYEADGISIERGYAEVIRKAPSPTVTYGKQTEESLNDEAKIRLNLELLNVVIVYMLSHKATRTHKGNLVLQFA